MKWQKKKKKLFLGRRFNMAKLYLRGIGMMVGMIFGAGIFALPYSFSRSGLFWGVIHFVIAFSILVFLHFLYGEVAYYTKGKHRFTGYVEIFLGNKAKRFALITTIASYYGTLLVYGLLGGLFLFNIFGNSSAFKFSVIFFAIGAILSLFNLEKIASINFFLTIPIFGFIFYLLFAALPSIDMSHFLYGAGPIFNDDWFLPYGVWLFALGGFAVIPETRDFFSKSPIKSFKNVIFISLAVSALFYFLFAAAVWGVSGQFTTEDALSGILPILGVRAILIGSFIGFLAVFTSFLALANDAKNIFFYDYNISHSRAWFLAVAPPIILFLLGATDFVKILSVVGAVGLGTLGVFIIFMARSLRKKIKEDGSEQILKPTNGEFAKPETISQAIILTGILAGAVYELWRIFS